MASTTTTGTRLHHYCRRGRNAVQGWFGRVDAALFETLLVAQNEAGQAGAVAEIGLHHAKSFIPLCLARAAGERAYGIDVFEQQDLNQDRSGCGSRAKVEQNLQRFGVDLASVILDGRSSDEVAPSDILDSVGPIRFFSIDGGHWLEIVRDDLVLAEATLAEHGVIALDDFHRHDWPDVSAGYFAWYEQRVRPIVPIAMGVNKLYLAHESHADRYAEIIVNDPFLNPLIRKRPRFQGREVPNLQVYAWPEQTIARRIRDTVVLRHPDLFSRLVRTFRRRRGLVQE